MLAAYVRQELIKSAREGKPAERMKALVILARASGLLGGQPPPAQHLHMHGAELNPEERQRMLRMRRPRPGDGDDAAIEG